MKKLLLVLAFLILTVSTYAQDGGVLGIPTNDKGYAEYSSVVEVNNMSKDDLYLASLEWVNKTFNSGKTVTQTTDKEGGLIIGKALSSTLTYNNLGIKMDGGRFSYTFSIYCKDNKFKFVIENITYNKGEMALAPGADLAEDFPSNWKGLIMNTKYNKREWLSFQSQANGYFIFLQEDLTEYVKNYSKKNSW
jgi:hypothetical protein